jgi:hypothetical protein
VDDGFVLADFDARFQEQKHKERFENWTNGVLQHLIWEEEERNQREIVERESRTFDWNDILIGNGLDLGYWKRNWLNSRNQELSLMTECWLTAMAESASFDSFDPFQGKDSAGEDGEDPPAEGNNANNAEGIEGSHSMGSPTGNSKLKSATKRLSMISKKKSGFTIPEDDEDEGEIAWEERNRAL